MISTRTLKSLFLSFVLILPAVYCNGTLKVLVSNNIDNSRTIEPSINMSVSTYRISGAGPGGAVLNSMNIPVSQNSIELTSLASDSWTITVSDLNPEGIEIGRGVGIINMVQVL